MLPTEFANSVFVLGMFVLRLGVPVAITLALGYWLEKWLQPPAEEKPEMRRRMDWVRRAKSTRITQLHCWDLAQGEAARSAESAAVRHPDLPCWLALQMEGYTVRPECFLCARYTSHANAA
jgi:hypothetical protein